MTLTYVFQTALPNIQALSGKSYLPSALGILTGVTGTDAVELVQDPRVRLLCATGLTTDRPSSTVAPALTGSQADPYPAPTVGMPFADTSLTKTVYYVGTVFSSTGWVDNTGAVA